MKRSTTIIELSPKQLIGILLNAYEAGQIEMEKSLTGKEPGVNGSNRVVKFFELLENTYKLKIKRNEKNP